MLKIDISMPERIFKAVGKNVIELIRILVNIKVHLWLFKKQKEGLERNNHFEMFIHKIFQNQSNFKKKKFGILIWK